MYDHKMLNYYNRVDDFQRAYHKKKLSKFNIDRKTTWIIAIIDLIVLLISIKLHNLKIPFNFRLLEKNK